MTNNNGELPKIYVLSDIAQVTSSSEFQDKLIKGIADGFVAFEEGRFFAAPIQTLGAPPMAPFGGGRPHYAAQTCVKSGYFESNPYYVIKVASGGAPWENAGLMQVYSQETGRLEALLLDEGILTELRTAAVGALSLQLFAPSSIGCIGVLGAGVQARYQLRMIARATACRNVMVWARDTAKVKAYQEEMIQEGWTVNVVADADEMLENCEVIVTTTSARQPVLGTGHAQPRKTRLITCIGSDAPGKMELSPNLLKQASLLVADNPSQSVERGEFQALKDMPIDSIRSLGAIVKDNGPQRVKGAEKLIIVDSSGVALQDCVVAQMVYDTLKEIASS